MRNTKSIQLQDANSDAKKKFMVGVYAWMCVALLISGGVAYLTATIAPIRNFVLGNMFFFWILLLAELFLVFWLASSIMNMKLPTAVIVFLGYAILNGFTMSSIFILFTSTSVVRIFIITALMFAGMTIYGIFSKSNLIGAGRYLMMGLIGVLIAILVNLIISLFVPGGSSILDWIISLVIVVVFAGLTAVDTKQVLLIAQAADGTPAFKKMAIVGALELYLDFINIFYALLMLFGGRD